MDGKNSMKKSLRHIRHVQAARINPFVSSYMQIGVWRFQENDDGDLVIINTETNQTVILVTK